MKVLTISGTRPELIRLSVILRKLDKVVDHIHVFTSQNFEHNLSTLFLEELGIRKPDYILDTVKTGEFLGNGISKMTAILDAEEPDKILVLGDTNSVLLTIPAAKRGIPIYHMEAGNRCYDPKVPEETNRVIIDACSRYNLPYTENSKENLIREGKSKNYVFRVGNPIKEVLEFYKNKIESSDILMRLGIMPYTWDGAVANPYALLSFHRTENVDNKKRATSVIEAINEISEDIPVIFPCHPRTKDRFKDFGVTFAENVIVIDAIGFFDFVNLERHAKIVLTDSGTVPEETSLFGVPTIVLRNTTERQELMESGLFILAGTKKDDILRAYYSTGKLKPVKNTLWDYLDDNVSETVVRLLMGQQDKIEVRGHDEF